MRTQLLLLLCLTGHVLAKEPPAVDCLVVHLEHVHCSWNQQGTPEVNYTFYGWFEGDRVSECPTYLSENNMNTGCNLRYDDSIKRFNAFHTKLVHGNQSYRMHHELKNKVKLNPPTKVTVQIGYDSNLWLNWTQITKPTHCVESEVRYRINNGKWAPSDVSTEMHNYCINWPSHNSLYELQVRSRLGSNCGQSIFWSDWSEPVVWGSNNGTDPDQMDNVTFVWTAVLSAVSVFILVLLVLMLLHNERIRIIFVPVLPKPSLKLHDIENWSQFSSKGMKESFNYNERPCTVQEYCHVPESDSESSDCSTCSATTDQTDCSVFIPAVSGSDLSTHCSSSTSTSTVPVPSEQEEKQVSV